MAKEETWPASTAEIKLNGASKLPFHLRLTVRRGYWCGGGKVGRRTIFQGRPARGYLCLASARRIVARRIPPTLSRQREIDCLRPLGKQTVSAILKTNQKTPLGIGYL